MPIQALLSNPLATIAPAPEAERQIMSKLTGGAGRAMNAKEWFEANNSACWSGCVSGSSWEDCDFMHDDLTKLFEAAQPKWLPIESAPKDGIDIWLYDRQWSPDPQIGYWCYRLGSWLSDSGSKLNPTRWQPLPEPPKLKGEL